MKAAVLEETAQAPLVLVVDDDADIRASLTDMFLSVGMETLTYGSTAELMTAGLPDRPSCLILDLRLPGVSGLELQAQLSEKGIRLPIIFLTGYADVPTSVRAMKAGAVDFLPKPFREQELLDAVAEALRFDGERRRDEDEVNGIRHLGSQLTPRERDVLRGVGRGLLNKQIAFELGITEITVKMHRSSAGRKLKSVSVADMIRKIERLGL
ncbi:response regulator transcription factor [Sphingomonadaceae bacterium OTU29LAMAA1]|nr:response regulator transcription factor [Sphingomonadaceae bacterium OTU29LAMAA1]